MEVTRMSHFVGIGLVLGFLLPHTSTAFLLVNPLLCLFYLCFKQNHVFYSKNWLVLVPILFTLLINLSQDVSTKPLMSFFAIFLYFACFPMVRNVKVPNLYFYFILGFIFLSQVAYAYNITILESFLSTYYPLSEEDLAGLNMQNAITADTIMNFRLGGLYHNPNQCARSITFLLAGFLVLSNENNILKLLPFVIISYYAVLLTGSRTGVVVASLVIIAYFFMNKRISVGWRYGAILLGVFGAIYLIYAGNDTLRAFNVSDTGSSDAKLRTFLYYLSIENSVIRLLLGYLDESLYVSRAASYVMAGFDSDYGNIIFCYGFVGFFSIILFFVTIYRKMDRIGRVFFVLLLWMITSTIVKSYRALFIFMLLLSCVYGQHKKNSHIENI